MPARCRAYSYDPDRQEVGRRPVTGIDPDRSEVRFVAMDPDAPQPPRVMILWGIPGTGKTVFAKWLATEHGYQRVDNDEVFLMDPRMPLPFLEAAWRATIMRVRPPAAFMHAARKTDRPVVAEYGQYAEPERIALLDALRSVGADVWWFDGEPRGAALTAWRDRSRRVAAQLAAGVPVESPMCFPDDGPWETVVGKIRRQWGALQRLYGASRILTTVTATSEGGYQHVPSATLYELMNSVIADEQVGR